MATFAFGSVGMFDGDTIAILWNPTGAQTQGVLTHPLNLTVTVAGTPQTATFEGFLYVTNNVFISQYTIATAATAGQSVTITAAAGMVLSDNGNVSAALSAVTVPNDVVDTPTPDLIGFSTLANLKEWLNISVTTYDTVLTNILTRACKAIENDLGVNILAATYLEAYDGNDEEAIVLNQAPIQNILGVWYSYPDGTVVEVDSDEYSVDESAGILNRVSSVEWNEPDGSMMMGSGISATTGGGWTLGRGRTSSWARGKSNVMVAYQAGYLASAIPADIEQEAIETAAEMWYQRQLGGGVLMTSEKTEGYEYTRGAVAMSTERTALRKAVRDGYRRWRAG